MPTRLVALPCLVLTFLLGSAAPAVAQTIGPARQGAAQAVPKLPREARELLPPGCLQAWESPSHALPAKTVSMREPHALGFNPPALGFSPPAGKQALPNDVLSSQPLPSQAIPRQAIPDQAAAEAVDPHRSLFLESEYPSALTCAKCHPQQFEEWRTSGHAYSAISPMFQRFEQKMVDLSQGTVGTFCYRCHSPVGVQAGVPRYASILDGPPILREGISCVACHRVAEQYGKTNGYRRVEPGDIYQRVTSGGNGADLARAIADKEALKIKTDPRDVGPGQPMHAEILTFEPITRSDFCLPCHQVAVHPGIWLEVVYAQYSASPASAKGITCQDCHMGAVPGKPEGYDCRPLAEIGGKPWGTPKPHANHSFWGPGYSIAHPGLFPIHAKGERWSPREWLRFDWQAGWGTEAFERSLSDAAETAGFPPPWDNADERRDARRILDENLAALDRERAGSIAIMETAAEITGPVIAPAPQVNQPLRFHYTVRNTSEGHNLPTGSLGAQPQVWLDVALVDPFGQTVWESGYLDTQGDLADLQSGDVARGIVARDGQLFNLQTKFLITNVKGTEREVPLPVNFDVDQIPFLRPGAVPISVLNHPPLIRMEAHSIPPLDHRQARYEVPPDRIRIKGIYRLDARLRSRVEPSYLMRFVGSTPEMINRMNHQILDIHPRSFHFTVH